MLHISRWRFSVLAMLIYGMLMLIPLSMHNWDISRFIVAGDRYVDKNNLDSRIEIRPNSSGYDGQFYYRLAIDPHADTIAAHGVTFDSPAWRHQRIGYPFLAYLLSLGRPNLVPWALFALNLIGLGVLALMIRRIQHQLELPDWFSWGAMLWPGYAVTLTHDTTEIVAVALLAAALSAYLSGRLRWYALLAALTTLTRETSIILFGGIFLYEAWSARAWTWVSTKGLTDLRADRTRQQAFGQLFLAGLVMVPYLVWRQYLTWHWGMSPQQSGNGNNMSLPFGGIIETLWNCITGARHWNPNPLDDILNRIVLGSGAVTVALGGIWTATRLPDLFRRHQPVSALTIGWGILAALMSTLTAYVPNTSGGPWVDVTAAFRAFTEFWLVMLLLLAASGVHLPRWSAVPAVLIWGIGMAITL